MSIDEFFKKSNAIAGGNIAPNAFVAKGAEAEYPVNFMHSTSIYGCTHIGKYTYINVGSIVYPHVKIGRFCSIARDCEIGVADHPTSFLSTHPFQFDTTIFKDKQYREISKKKWLGHKNTTIGNDVWIGAKVIIKSGVVIEHGAIIAAGSVVTKNIPAYSIVGGIPAKVLKYRFSDETIDSLLKLQWWELDIGQLQNISFDNIDLAIKELKAIRRKKKK